MRLHPLLLPALTLLGACSTEQPREAAVPAIRAELVATIGADSGQGSFASVRSLLFTPAGELLVVDDREKQVKVFDSTGHFLRLLGRTGAGPGEYAWPYSIAWIGDTLALLDPGNSRIGLFDEQSAWAGQLPVQPITGGSDIRLYRSTGPELWAYGYRVVGNGTQGLYIRYTTAGPQDSLPLYRWPQGPTTTIACEEGRNIRFFDAPFAPSDLQLPLPRGERAIARTDAYRIDILGPAGDTIRTISRTESGDPITDAEWERGLEEWNTMRRESPSTKCDAGGFDRPVSKPILGAIFRDPQERLWVEVRRSTGTRHDLYDATGARVATLNGLPAVGEVEPTFRGDLIAIAGPTNDGIPTIGIYRLVPETN